MIKAGHQGAGRGGLQRPPTHPRPHTTLHPTRYPRSAHEPFTLLTQHTKLNVKITSSFRAINICDSCSKSRSDAPPAEVSLARDTLSRVPSPPSVSDVAIGLRGALLPGPAGAACETLPQGRQVGAIASRCCHLLRTDITAVVCCYQGRYNTVAPLGARPLHHQAVPRRDIKVQTRMKPRKRLTTQFGNIFTASRRRDNTTFRQTVSGHHFCPCGDFGVRASVPPNPSLTQQGSAGHTIILGEGRRWSSGASVRSRDPTGQQTVSGSSGRPRVLAGLRQYGAGRV
ncbi:hypothetical protein E2C01_023373 [Portunus trituberculatus]|uniref:Uncharacterized protein n=1 Tax=Portunus trituberculatus TaxID=210409 RepID=A0A5B7EBE2_PORTR|nr:hypothetical protein [Portunus trituberculatus]